MVDPCPFAFWSGSGGGNATGPFFAGGLAETCGGGGSTLGGLPFAGRDRPSSLERGPAFIATGAPTPSRAPFRLSPGPGALGTRSRLPFVCNLNGILERSLLVCRFGRARRLAAFPRTHTGRTELRRGLVRLVRRRMKTVRRTSVRRLSRRRQCTFCCPSSHGPPMGVGRARADRRAHQSAALVRQADPSLSCGRNRDAAPCVPTCARRAADRRPRGPSLARRSRSLVHTRTRSPVRS